MSIRQKTREELLSQTEWFLNYAEKNWTIWTRTKDKILEIFSMDNENKKWFLARLSKKLWKSVNINDKWDIEKFLIKNHIYNSKLFDEYNKYLKIIKIIEPFKEINPKLNDDIIWFIMKSENINKKGIVAFLKSNMFEKCTELNFFTLDYIINRLWSELTNEDFNDLLNLSTFESVNELASTIIQNIKAYILILKNSDIFWNEDIEFIIKRIKEGNINDEMLERLQANITLSKQNPILKKHVIDFNEWFSRDLVEIINREKEIIIWTDFYNVIWRQYCQWNSLSEQQKGHLLSIFNWDTFDLSDKEVLKLLFTNQTDCADIITLMEKFNIIKTEIPNFSTNMFLKDRIYTHLYSDSNPKLLKQWLKTLKELWFKNTEELTKMLIYWSNSANGHSYFSDVVEITKSYIKNLWLSANELLDIYKSLYHDYEHKESIMPMLTSHNNEYIDLYKKTDNIDALKKLWLSNKAVISSHFTQISTFKKLLSLWITIEEINKIFDDDPVYNDVDYKYFEIFIQRLLTSNRYGLMMDNNSEYESNTINALCDLLPTSKREFIIPILRIIWDKFWIFIDVYDEYRQTAIKKIFVNIDTITDRIDINELIAYLEKHEDTFCHTSLENSTSNLNLIINNFKNLDLGKLDLVRELNIDPEILQIIFDRMDISIDELNSLKGTLTGIKPVNLSIFFNSYNGEISIAWLKEMNMILKYWDQKNLSNIFTRYENISIKELKSLSGIIRSANSWCLYEILNFYKDISISELVTVEDIITKMSWKDNLKLIFEKYPSISFNELDLLQPTLSCISCECLKILFDEYWIIQIVDLASIWDSLRKSNPKCLKLVFDYFWPIKLINLCEFKKLTYQKALPDNLIFKESNHQWYLKFFIKICDTTYSWDKKLEMMRKLATLSFNEAENYLSIFQMLDDSISMDIQRIKNEMIDKILESNDPEKIAETIINIFERNNLPLTWKIFKVFELLYSKDKLKNTLQLHWSPILHQFLDEWKNAYSLIYWDLMNIAIKSWDRSLKNYINAFVWSESILKKFESIISESWFDSGDKLCLEWKLDEREQEQLLYLFRKCSVLYNRYYWKDIEEWGFIEDKVLWISNISDDQLVKFYNDIKKWFHLKNWESVYDRLQRFLWWLWYHSFEDVLNKMNESKKIAHEHWLKLYNESNWWKIVFPQQAFLKWVDEYAFSRIINRWIMCREYLWWWENWKAAWSDSTPFDIDWWYTDSFVEWGYGNVNLVVNTKKENIYDSREKWIEWYTKDKYELFKTWVLWEKHYGIRTWIPTTEIDYLIYTWNFESKEFQTICYEIARNWYYIPIVDRDWNIKFTPETYHRIRSWFNYMKYYDWFDVQEIDWKYELKVSDNEIHRVSLDDELSELIAENSPQNEKYRNFAKENRELAENTIQRIKKILEEKCWIKFNSKYDSSITWAELHDSWSTWRWTDIPTKDVDLDFTLILDAKDYERVAEISKAIHEEIWTQKNDDHWVIEWWNQIKSKINNIWKSEERPNWVPLDLLILKKSQVVDYSSSDAMKEKLDYIASNSETWAEDLDRVRTNIIIMKKLLKAKWCYKKPEWWIAWIWVENWIMQHHWNFIEALESFEQVAYWWEYEEWREPISLSEFKKLYPMYDAWENYKDWCNDNFVYKLEESGYQWTLEIIKMYRLKWIVGVKELIQQYEDKKSEFIS